MANRQLILNKQEVVALKQAAQQSQNPAEAKRFQAIRLYGTGHPVKSIAEVVDTSIASVYRWAWWYKQGGLAKLKTNYGGNQNAAKLTVKQQVDLSEKLHQYGPHEVLEPNMRISQSKFWTVSDLKVVVKQWYGVVYQSETSYRKLFKTCNFSFQRTSGQYRSRANQQDIADFEAGLEKK